MLRFRFIFRQVMAPEPDGRDFFGIVINMVRTEGIYALEIIQYRRMEKLT
jgi:hypothetical protein